MTTTVIKLTEKQLAFMASTENPKWLTGDRGEGKTFGLCAAIVDLCVKSRVRGLLICGSDFLAREIVAPILYGMTPNWAKFMQAEMKFIFPNGSTVILVAHGWEEKTLGWMGDFVAMDYDPGEPPTDRQVENMMAMTRATPNRPAQGHVMIAGRKP